MSIQVARRFFTVDEYHRMGEVGILSENDRIELIEGEILQMSPIGSRHAACVKRLTKIFTTRLGDQAIVSVQDPVVLGDFSEPEPDIAILKPRDDFYDQALPNATDVLLVIEVADTTIEYDREIKLPAYARAGIPETWICDLRTEVVNAHRDPVNGIYRQVRTHRRGDSTTPHLFPDLALDINLFFG